MTGNEAKSFIRSGIVMSAIAYYATWRIKRTLLDRRIRKNKVINA